MFRKVLVVGIVRVIFDQLRQVVRSGFRNAVDGGYVPIVAEGHSLCC